MYLALIKVSYYRISEIKPSPWPDVCIVLLKNGSFMLVNFVKKAVILEAASNSLSMDSPLSVNLHQDNKFLISASLTGTINYWHIG